MFISKSEKQEMQIAIDLLKGQIAFLCDEIRELRASKQFKGNSQTKAFIIRTAEAPWGYKLDGTPKKRPGTAPQKNQEIKNEQPLPV
jgi:hypothetical protein